MIRGPVVPLSRDGLWRLVCERSELLERGLSRVAEGLELGEGRQGFVDGLLRDANGAPVLVFVADDRDPGLPARVLAAHGFWQRNAAGMARALPEADLLDGRSFRLVVVGATLGADVLATLDRLALPELEVVEIESFQVAGQERLVVRPHRGRLGAVATAPIDDAVGGNAQQLIAGFEAIAVALDPKIRVDGDRFSRRASLAGRRLGECWFAEDRVRAAVEGSEARILQGRDDLRAIGDLLARRYLALLGRGPISRSADAAAADGAAAVPPRGAFDLLRASVSATRLSRDECRALGESEATDDGEEALAGG